MKKLPFIALIVVITLINVLVGSLLFLDIQLIETPNTTITIDILELDSDEAIIKTEILVDNPNDFSFVMENFEIITTTPDGHEVIRLPITGGSIPPNDSRTFTETGIISFDGEIPEVLHNKLTGKLGMSLLGFIIKTIPLEIAIVINTGDILKDISAPEIDIKAEFGEITQDGANITGSIIVNNPNSFDIYINDFSILMETSTGENVGDIYTAGGEIKAGKTSSFKINGMILIDALNSKKLYVTIEGIAGIKAIGVNKSIDFSPEIEITLPDLDDIISSKTRTDVTIKSDFRITLTGLISDISLEVYNPNKIALEAKDIKISMYSITNDNKHFIGELELGGGVIDAENTTIFTGEMKIPYAQMLSPGDQGIIPDWIQIQVEGNTTIYGLNHYMWLSVSGYQDMHPLRKSQ